MKRLIRIRKDHPVLHQNKFREGETDNNQNDIHWLKPDGEEMSHADWENGAQKEIGFLLNDHNDKDSDSLLILINAGESDIVFAPPGTEKESCWEILLDTMEPEGQNSPKTQEGNDIFLMKTQSLKFFRMKNEKIIVKISNEIRELIPEYLKNRRDNVASIRESLEDNNFESIQTLGHMMKGSGESFGFDQITAIGESIERAAKEKSSSAVRKSVDDLSDFLDRLEVIYE